MAHHQKERELWVGFHRKGTARPSITWPESVDEALCVGWIDGIRKTVDADSYKIRFTPRKAASIWSAVNIGRVEQLTREGRMQPAGLEAFAKRTEGKSRTYAYENKEAAALTPEDEREFRASPDAWEFFQTQPPWYRKQAMWRVMSAKRPETREKRLGQLIAKSKLRERI